MADNTILVDAEQVRERLKFALDRECRTRDACKKRGMDSEDQTLNRGREAFKHAKKAETLERHIRLLKTHEENHHHRIRDDSLENYICHCQFVPLGGCLLVSRLLDCVAGPADGAVVQRWRCRLGQEVDEARDSGPPSPDASPCLVMAMVAYPFDVVVDATA